MALKWNRSQFAKQKENLKPAPIEQKIRRVRLKWKTTCRECGGTLRAGTIAAYEPTSKACFCAACIERTGTITVPRRPYHAPKLKGPHLVVENGQVRYVDHD